MTHLKFFLTAAIPTTLYTFSISLSAMIDTSCLLGTNEATSREQNVMYQSHSNARKTL